MVKIITPVVKGTPKHLSKGGLNSFTYLAFNLEFICNYNCSKCFNGGNKNPIYTDKPISTEKRISLIDEAEDLEAKVIVLAGSGEPTLVNGTNLLIKHISKKGMIPILYTNSLTLNEDKIKFYKEHGVVLALNFDSLIEESYNSLTGTKGNLSKVMKNHKLINKIYGKPKIKDNLQIHNIAIITTLSEINKNEISKLKNYAKNLGFYFVCNSLAKTDTNNFELLNKNFNKEEHEQIINKFSESGGPLTLFEGYCGYSKYGIAISPSGDYMTCAYTDKTNGLLGNIKNASLKEAFERKHKIEQEHYKEFGKMPCLIRNKNFKKYIKTLN